MESVRSNLDHVTSRCPFVRLPVNSLSWMPTTRNYAVKKVATLSGLVMALHARQWRTHRCRNSLNMSDTTKGKAPVFRLGLTGSIGTPLVLVCLIAELLDVPSAVTLQAWVKVQLPKCLLSRAFQCGMLTRYISLWSACLCFTELYG